MLERNYYEQGYRAIFGIDEAGRGPMAGPLVAGAVCLPLDDSAALIEKLKGVKDSKQMTPRQRERASQQIQEVALAWGIGSVEAHEIPQVGNMTQVTLEAMRRALLDAEQRSGIKADFLLIDYYKYPYFPEEHQKPLTKGDTLSLCIAAASVLAKVYRDDLMLEYAKKYPVYEFDTHKGYPTPAHLAALEQYGACAIHRTNYAPVQKVIGQRLNI